MRPLISKKSFSCIIIGSAVMSYIIKYVIEKLGDPIENIVLINQVLITKKKWNKRGGLLFKRSSKRYINS